MSHLLLERYRTWLCLVWVWGDGQQDSVDSGWLRLEGTSEGPLIQPPAQAGPPRARCPRPRRMESPQPPCQCTVTRTVKKCLLTFRRSLLYSSLCSLRLVLALGTAEKSLASVLGEMPQPHHLRGGDVKKKEVWRCLWWGWEQGRQFHPHLSCSRRDLFQWERSAGS